MDAITVTNLSKSYGKTKALNNISFEVKQGKFFGFLGPNGAGKTTTIRILTGQTGLDGGGAEILGINVKKSMEIKKEIGIVPEVTSLPSFLTVYEYLEFVCGVRNVNAKKIDFWLEFVELFDRRNEMCKDLSKGMKQKLSFAAAFIHDPRLVFLDEPFVDVDPLMQNKTKSFLRDYVKKGGTIFLSTHILEIAEKLCSRIAIIHRGGLLKIGTLSEFLRDGKNLEDSFLTLVKDNE